jgi:hypothetical protein
MDGTVALQNFFQGTAITNPKELGAPKDHEVLADSPATASSFAEERVEMPFSFGAAARSKSNEAKMSAIHGQIEDACTIGTEQSKGDCGGIGVVRLHEDPAHAGASPIGLEKTRKRKQC